VPRPAHGNDRGQGSGHWYRQLICQAPPGTATIGSGPADQGPRRLRNVDLQRRESEPGEWNRPRWRTRTEIALVRSDQVWTGPLGPESRRSDCMMANVVVMVKTSMSAAASTPVYFATMGAAARSVTVSRWALTPAQAFSP
jgi:hypothetical protein